jgi:hypothetical protein
MTDQLSEAITLIKQGNKTAAKHLLAALVLEQPNNEAGWLWLFACLDDNSQRAYCLSQALRINPENTKAKEIFHKMRQPASQFTQLIEEQHPPESQQASQHVTAGHATEIKPAQLLMQPPPKKKSATRPRLRVPATPPSARLCEKVESKMEQVPYYFGKPNKKEVGRIIEQHVRQGWRYCGYDQTNFNGVSKEVIRLFGDVAKGVAGKTTLAFQRSNLPTERQYGYPYAFNQIDDATALPNQRGRREKQDRYSVLDENQRPIAYICAVHDRKTTGYNLLVFVYADQSGRRKLAEFYMDEKAIGYNSQGRAFNARLPPIEEELFPKSRADKLLLPNGRELISFFRKGPGYISYNIPNGMLFVIGEHFYRIGKSLAALPEEQENLLLLWGFVSFFTKVRWLILDDELKGWDEIPYIPTHHRERRKEK